MMRERPCMLCNQPMDNGVCHTLGCAYNPEAEGQIHEAEWEFDEKLHQEIGEFDPEDLPHHHEGDPDDEFVHLPDTEGLEGKFEDEEPIHADDLTQEQRDQRTAPEGETPKDDQLDNQINQDAQDADDRMGGGEQNKEKQLTDEDKGEDPSDDVRDKPEGQQNEDDPDLPPRPQGCNGDCQPGDQYDDDADPCPHCTAKSFQQEMEQEGKQHQAPEEMEKDWQDFLDNWQNEAKGGGQQEGQGQGQGEEGDEQGELPTGEHQAPDLDGDDDDLPPQPQGCDGNCQPADQYDMDADPCPHCTAKSFRDEMREQEKEADMEFGQEDLDQMFQDFLKDWQNQQEEAKDDAPEEKPERNPEEIDEAPPEDEMQDGMPKEKPEKQVPEHEDEDPDEFKRVAQKMTVTQEKRFDNIVERIEKKVEATFGQTAEDIFVQAKQEGQFKGEEVSQTIQVTSRGVTFWVTISAAKEI
jgi:hypothetical protein